MSTALREALNILKVGDIFEAGKLFGLSDEPIVWCLESIEELEIDMLDGTMEKQLEYSFELFYYDVYLMSKDIVIPKVKEEV